MDYIEILIKFVVSFVLLTAFGSIFQALLEGSGFPLVWVIELVLPGSMDSVFGLLKTLVWAIGATKILSA